ncbi:MAG: box helicase domain protein [Clostridia bacterium]|nr:box helicase domain protein [Clostridia bacterium]
MNNSTADGLKAFNRLSPFIREYIYKNNWTELREIQVEACRIIFDTDSHLLLSSGTASGKTEAAFLPVLTKLLEDPPLSVGVLYIAPMKSLINDQFARLSDLVKESGIKLCHWHGDVSRSQKQKYMQNPSGVLQITPESLESMLISRGNDLSRIFGDLRFVVIDEMHAFMNSDRGTQILCQLERLERFILNSPRRIGLSATLGDYELPKKWLAANTRRPVEVPAAAAPAQKIKLSVEHYLQPALEDNYGIYTDPSMIYLYEKTLNKKAIIFGNGRDEADAAIAVMHGIAKMNGTPDVYYVHHGAVSATLREEAENLLKESEGSVVVGATVTMELGIDIGRLERVLQLGAPISVASFVQRLGRTGRRGNPAEMWFLDWEMDPGLTPGPLKRIHWRLLHIIAIIQLYVEEKWIEPPKLLKYPMSVLYHQIMSVTASAGELSFDALVSSMLSLSPFQDVAPNDIRAFIYSLIEIEHLQQMQDGGIIIGLEGEKVVNSYDFFGVFPTEEEWIVMHGPEKIGHVEEPVYIGEYITVAGYNWLVTGVDQKRLLLFVQPMPKNFLFLWLGDRALVHDRIIKRIRQVLFEDTVYPYLSPTAAECLKQSREDARKAGFDRYNVIDLENGSIGILPWVGHRNYYTIRNMIAYYLKSQFKMKKIYGMRPYYITFKKENGNAKEFLEAIQKLTELPPEPDSFIPVKNIRIIKKDYEYKIPKYDRYSPDHLLKKQVITDYVDMDTIIKEISLWKSAENIIF